MMNLSIFLAFLCLFSLTNAQLPVTPPRQISRVQRFRYQNRIFSYNFERMTYPEAQVECGPSRQGDITSSLLIIDSAEIQQAVERQLRDEIGVLPNDNWGRDPFAPGYWVAGNDLEIEGVWRWSNRQLIPSRSPILGYQNWYRQGGFNEPSSRVAGEDCLYINAILNAGPQYPRILGSWFDSGCFVRKYFICQSVAPINPCDSSPCRNGGLCTSVGSSFRCTCRPGFLGPTCSEIFDPCSSFPCLNGGICSRAGTTFQCSCRPGFLGPTCSIVANPCSSFPCLNGGICSRAGTTFQCSCRPGFLGPTCSIVANPCSSFPCLNGGICSRAGTTFQCSCRPGFLGPTCSIVANPCDSSPCANGICRAIGAGVSFECSCFPGYLGPTCNIMADPCGPSPCFNGGLCRPIGTSFECTCLTGYLGPTCSIADPCVSLPCLNGGSCSSFGNSFQCSCLSGYSGPTCNLASDPCSPNRCLNGGQCIDLTPSTYLCQCAPGFSGQTCEIRRDVGWLQWSGWSECTATCGQGTWFRFRGCQGAQPGDALCPGVGQETTNCVERECTGWSQWGSYGSCSATCGAGIETRQRTCLPPGTLDDICGGSSVESQPCNGPPCERYGPWTFDGPCSVTCGSGSRPRVRICIGGTAGFGNCAGPDRDSVPCDLGLCSSWGPWVETPCSTTCGLGIITRSRECLNSFFDGDCEGESTQVDQCFLETCPGWSEWNSWSACSATCGGGSRSRTRFCANGNIGDLGCEFGGDSEAEACNLVECQGLSNWSPWGDCSVTCGEGVRERSRQTTGVSLECVETIFETEACILPVCAVFWSQWSSLGSCSASCAAGLQQRVRRCIGGIPGSVGCEGQDREEILCFEGACPIWRDWTLWSDCSATCGGGTSRRERDCMDEDPTQILCPGSAEQVRICNDFTCTDGGQLANCTLLDVAFVLDSSSSIGADNFELIRDFLRGVIGVLDVGQDATRFAAIRYNSQIEPLFSFTDATSVEDLMNRINRIRYDGEGTLTGNALAYVAANTFRRANGNRPNVPDIAFVLTDGISQDNPEATVELLRRQNVRVVVIAVTDMVDVDEINAIADDPDSANAFFIEDFDALTNVVENIAIAACGRAQWTAWGSWSECGGTCGPDNVRSRSRSCEGGFERLAQICDQGEGTETETCNTDPCRTFEPWSPFSECSTTCGGGVFSRTRRCLFGNVGDPGCIGETFEILPCNTGTCASWDFWNSWGTCTATCGGGTRSRIRSCNGGLPGDLGCLGNDQQIESCNTLCCPDWGTWSQTSQCSASCGGGVFSRSRVCTCPCSPCEGLSEDNVICNTQNCPAWLPWSEWSDCTQTCVGGTQVRTRVCSGGMVGDGGCLGSRLEERNCNELIICTTWATFPDPPPPDTPDTQECTEPCGNNGFLRQRRECLGGNPGDSGCEGDDFRVVPCNRVPCPDWSTWDTWGTCSTTCGPGERTRLRFCFRGTEASTDCPGEGFEQEFCNIGACSGWIPWAPWSACGLTCGGGLRSRVRFCVFGSIGDPGCTGDRTEQESCNVFDCEPPPPWSTWGDCSVTCGIGVRERFRVTSGGNIECVDGTSETEVCFRPDCAALWSQWTNLGSCSVTCGAGLQQRARRCIGGLNGDVGCEGADRDEIPCFPGTCPVWRDWSLWSDCSATCGGGISRRERECVDDDPIQVLCSGPSDQERICNDFRCSNERPLDNCTSLDVVFVLDSSSSIGALNFELIRDFLRQVVQALDVGLDATRFAAIRYNNRIEPLFSFTDATNAEELRNRIDAIPYDGEGTLTGNALAYVAANTLRRSNGNRPEVPDIVFVLTDGMAQDNPEATVELLRRQNARVVVIAVTNNVDRNEINAIADDPDSANAFFVQNFDDLTTVVENIAIAACGRAQWTAWGSWSECGGTCGPDNVRSRSRSCEGGFGRLFRVCPQGESTQAEACNTDPCTTFDLWSPFSECSTTCGGGTFSRTRRCLFGNVGNRGCVGETFEILPCNTGTCASWDTWSLWTTCTATCGGGSRSRSRVCIGGLPGDLGCLGDQVEAESCNTLCCSEWESWSETSQCSAACGGGYSLRTRVCPCPCLPCDGENQEVNLCNAQPCASWGPFGPYGDCSQECGGGFQTRTRVCLGDVLSGNSCVGSPVEQRLCNTQLCIVPCSDNPVIDVVFVVDSSSSVGQANFDLVQGFITRLVSEFFQVENGAAQIGYVRYNREVDPAFLLGDFTTTQAIIDAINRVQYSGSGTMTGAALQYVADNALSTNGGRRPNVPAVVIVITDGLSQDSVVEASQALRAQAQVVAIGIAGAVRTELDVIASPPLDQNVFEISDFNQLQEFERQISATACAAERMIDGSG